MRVLAAGLIAVLLFLLGGAGCKRADIDPSTGDLAGFWRLEIAYHASSNLNLPWIMLITLHENGGFDVFAEPKGSYTVTGDEIRFGFAYADRYRSVTHQFDFLCTLPSGGRMSGELTDGAVRVGEVTAVKVNALTLFDVTGEWDFAVTFAAGSQGLWAGLPAAWRFSFTGSGEVWLGNARKQTFDFDGLNLRFPCHYYLDEATGSAKHLMFVGTMSDPDHMTGYLFNDVGDNLILGDFTGVRN